MEEPEVNINEEGFDVPKFNVFKEFRLVLEISGFDLWDAEKELSSQTKHFAFFKLLILGGYLVERNENEPLELFHENSPVWKEVPDLRNRAVTEIYHCLQNLSKEFMRGVIELINGIFNKQLPNNLEGINWAMAWLSLFTEERLHGLEAVVAHHLNHRQHKDFVLG